jgi:hypothetical protein
MDVRSRSWVAVVGLPLCLAAPLAPAAVAPTPPDDGPFGIYIGEPLAALGSVQKLSHSKYLVLHPAKSNDNFSTVAVTAYPSTGVCTIEGGTDHIQDDPTGDKVITIVDQLADALKAKYGRPDTVDECDADENDCKNNWSQKVKEGVARYGYKWDFANTPRDDRVWRMALLVDVSDSGEPSGGVVYFGANHAACNAAADMVRGSGI